MFDGIGYTRMDIIELCPSTIAPAYRLVKKSSTEVRKPKKKLEF
jgi:hypothetical protein